MLLGGRLVQGGGGGEGWGQPQEGRSLLPQAGVEEASVAPQAVARKEPMKEKTPRVDWVELLRRMFDFDVFACVRCGGRRRVLA